MDIRQLSYFIAIVEEGSISKAAKKLHIAQPPLSHQLKLLEDELGVKLVERNTRKLKITNVGELLSHRAKQVLDLIDTTIKEVHDLNSGIQGTLSIGTVSSAGATLLPEHINKFQLKYPLINFEILDEDTNKIIELLKNGVIDIGFIRTPFNDEMLESICLPVEPMVAIGTELHWNMETEKHICLDKLKTKPLIVQKRYEKLIVELCQKSGFEPRILCKSNDIRTILLWARNGIGLAIIPKNCVELISNTNLKYTEINEPSLNVGTAIIWMKNRYLSSVAKHFLESFQT